MRKTLIDKCKHVGYGPFFTIFAGVDPCFLTDVITMARICILEINMNKYSSNSTNGYFVQIKATN